MTTHIYGIPWVPRCVVVKKRAVLTKDMHISLYHKSQAFLPSKINQLYISYISGSPCFCHTKDTKMFDEENEEVLSPRTANLYTTSSMHSCPL